MTVTLTDDARARAYELEQEIVRYPEERGEILLEAADQWKRAGEVDHAVRLLGEVLALGDEDAGFARHSLAEICFEQGADSDAWAHLRALEETEPSGQGPAELVAELLEQRGEYSEALRWFERAIGAEDPERLVAIGRRGATPSLTAIPLFGRQRCRAKLGLPADELDRVADVADDNRRDFFDRLQRAPPRPRHPHGHRPSRCWSGSVTSNSWPRSVGRKHSLPMSRATTPTSSSGCGRRPGSRTQPRSP